MNIKYAEGYKYQLVENAEIQTDILGYTAFDDFYCLTIDGVLLARKGYAWDGPSGICPDWEMFQQPSLWHDVLFQMMRRKQLPVEECFHKANELFYHLSLERQKWFQAGAAKSAYWAVEKFGMKFAHPQPDKILTAP